MVAFVLSPGNVANDLTQAERDTMRNILMSRGQSLDLNIVSGLVRDGLVRADSNRQPYLTHYGLAVFGHIESGE